MVADAASIAPAPIVLRYSRLDNSFLNMAIFSPVDADESGRPSPPRRPSEISRSLVPAQSMPPAFSSLCRGAEAAKANTPKKRLESRALISTEYLLFVIMVMHRGTSATAKLVQVASPPDVRKVCDFPHEASGVEGATPRPLGRSPRASENEQRKGPASPHIERGHCYLGLLTSIL